MISRDAFPLWLFCDSVVHHSIASTCPPGSYSVSQFDAVKMYALPAWTTDGPRVLSIDSEAILSTPPNIRLSVHFSQLHCFYLFPDH